VRTNKFDFSTSDAEGDGLLENLKTLRTQRAEKTETKALFEPPRTLRFKNKRH